MSIINQVKEQLSMFKNLYDSIRIVDPINKEASFPEGEEMQKFEGTCYTLWKKNTFCKNCVSMKAYINNDTFVKIEYGREKIFLVTATPIEIDGKVLVAELIKDITKNGTILHMMTKDSDYVEELVSSINEKTIKDELTGLYNRRYINERLPVDINYSKIGNLPISIIMTDIDFFKKVNDRYGHVIGDKVLTDFSNLIVKSIRSSTDWVARFGGEEFIIVLNNTDLKDAYAVAEKIRTQLEKITFKYDEINVNITASFGVYNVADYNMELLTLLSRVDANLYEAKISGRNRTIANQENINKDGYKSINEESIKLSKLNNNIRDLKDTLNEICCTNDAGSSDPRRLVVSQFLDELIVEYMKEANSKTIKSRY